MLPKIEVLNQHKICLKMLEMATLETQIFKNFWWSMPPDSPRKLAPSALELVGAPPPLLQILDPPLGKEQKCITESLRFKHVCCDLDVIQHVGPIDDEPLPSTLTRGSDPPNLRWLEIVSWRARPEPLIARARASTPGSRRCKFSNLVPSKILQNLYFDQKYL